MPDDPNLVDVVCRQRDSAPLAMTVMITMGLLLGLSLLYVSPGDDAFPILVIDAVLIAVSLVFFGGIYWYCTRRAMEE